MNSKNILISAIGKGTIDRNGNSIGYRKTEYIFEPGTQKEYICRQTAFFGVALYEYLTQRQKLQIDKFIIFGTEKSAWSELLYLVPDNCQSDEKLLEIYSHLYDLENSHGKAVTCDDLKKWQEYLQKYISNIKLEIIDPLDSRAYMDAILKELEKDEEYNIIYDCTHAFRHIPIIFTYVLMLSKYLRKVKDIRLFYGAYEMKSLYSYPEGKSPAIEIGFVNEAVSLIESLASFENSGYFPDLLEALCRQRFETTYFKLEMNRQPKREIKAIIEMLEDKKRLSSNAYLKELSDYLLEEFSDINNRSRLHLRMYKRSQFFFERNQYLKALVLLYESFIILFADVYRFNNMDYDSREKSRKKVLDEIENLDKNPSLNKLFKSKDEAKLFKTLEYVRNAAVHGSAPRCDQNYLENIDQFKQLFSSASNLFERLVQRADLS
ncbi:TIGR02221 family CRISPR-associated protein [Anaerocellum danielii]|uniref:TIGR02221 family CRISPR-associated protein n=1 Tax=Anaerocellum danielii TaxID=1387557 RepID=A0ABZ0U0X5_9FIRM|nr:TIGR02221 family CRISPR-associated protein [Caldicellulosiruptor danielii]WPX08747.1 TIGR02221 family CRISPR-associated protein [Caldicellulosiruptor danielii]